MNKLIISLLLIFYLSNLLAEDAYKYRLMGKMKAESIVLDNGSTFNFFSWDGAFSDNKGNFGDGYGRGIREAGPDGNLINLNVLNVFEDSKGKGSFWARSRRVDSGLEGGGGYSEVLDATGIFEFLKNTTCRYAVSFTKKGAVYQETTCKLE